jgi:type VI secretion system protein ImpC
LPCTERMLSSKMADLVSKHRFMPMLSIKGQPETRLGGLGSVAGGPLAGSWKPVTGSSDAAPAAEAEAPAEEKAESTEETPAESTEAPAEAAAEAPASDPELDKLLADLNPEPAAEEAKTEEAASAAEGEPEMDPELAKLLKELG